MSRSSTASFSAGRFARYGRETNRGTINLNTNGSRPEAARAVVDSGLDSIRVSVNSLREDAYNAYYRPRGYGLGDVIETVRICRRSGVHVSLNLLYFPGFTDTPPEMDALARFIGEEGVDLVQMRNLNIDPELYIRSLPENAERQGIGVREFMKDLKKKFPDLRFGYFNPPKESYRSSVSA